MIIHHPSKKITSVPPPLEKITRTHELTVLGVTFNSTLSFSQHTQNLTAKATTSLGAYTPLQEAQLSPSDRAMSLVSSNLADYHATAQTLFIRQVLTKPMV